MADASAAAEEIRSKLRRGDGLTADKLAGCPAVLEALGTTDPEEALRKFVETVRRLPDDEHMGALRNALRLDPSLPEVLSGANGRRGRYAEKVSRSEESVRGWEEQAAKHLAQALVARTPELLTDVEVVYRISHMRVVHRLVVSFWQQGDGYSTRYSEEELPVSRRQILLPFAAHQLGANERPSSLTIDLVYPERELPHGTFGFSAADLFSLQAGVYEEDEPAHNPHPVTDLLRELQLPHSALMDGFFYQRRWYNPSPSLSNLGDTRNV